MKKIRAYNKISKQLLDWNEIIGYENDQQAITKNYRVLEDKEFVISFGTGLFDCIGKEVFEGDILSNNVEVDGKIMQSAQQVFWNTPTASYQLDNSYCQDESCSIDLWLELEDFSYKIIGNVFENIELLKNRKK